MKIKPQTACKILGALLAWEVVVEFNNRGIIARQRKQMQKLADLNVLLAQSMDRHGIELDEFEMIAISTIAE